MTYEGKPPQEKPGKKPRQQEPKEGAEKESPDALSPEQKKVWERVRECEALLERRMKAEQLLRELKTLDKLVKEITGEGLPGLVVPQEPRWPGVFTAMEKAVANAPKKRTKEGSLCPCSNMVKKNLPVPDAFGEGEKQVEDFEEEVQKVYRKVWSQGEWTDLVELLIEKGNEKEAHLPEVSKQKELLKNALDNLSNFLGASACKVERTDFISAVEKVAQAVRFPITKEGPPKRPLIRAERERRKKVLVEALGGESGGHPGSAGDGAESPPAEPQVSPPSSKTEFKPAPNTLAAPAPAKAGVTPVKKGAAPPPSAEGRTKPAKGELSNEMAEGARGGRAGRRFRSRNAPEELPQESAKAQEPSQGPLMRGETRSASAPEDAAASATAPPGESRSLPETPVPRSGAEYAAGARKEGGPKTGNLREHALAVDESINRALNLLKAENSPGNRLFGFAWASFNETVAHYYPELLEDDEEGGEAEGAEGKRRYAALVVAARLREVAHTIRGEKHRLAQNIIKNTELKNNPRTTKEEREKADQELSDDYNALMQCIAQANLLKERVEAFLGFKQLFREVLGTEQITEAEKRKVLQEIQKGELRALRRKISPRLFLLRGLARYVISPESAKELEENVKKSSSCSWAI